MSTDSPVQTDEAQGDCREEWQIIPKSRCVQLLMLFHAQEGSEQKMQPKTIQPVACESRRLVSVKHFKKEKMEQKGKTTTTTKKGS